MTDCPKHKVPLTVPTYRRKLECAECVREAQARLSRYMETLR